MSNSGIPSHPIGEYTLVHDRRSNQAVMRLEGVVILPVGAEIELINPPVSVRVVGVRLLAPNEGPARYVCLDVDMSETD